MLVNLSEVCYPDNIIDFLVVDDAVKTDADNSVDLKSESESDPCKMDGICPEVIKVYIFKADPGEDDIGEDFLTKEKKIFWCLEVSR